MEHLGKLQIDTRQIERSPPQYFRPPWTNIDHNRFDFEQFEEAQATKDTKLKLFVPSTKNTNITAKIYTDDGSKKDEEVGYAVELSVSTIRRRQFPQNYIYSPEQSTLFTPPRTTTKIE
jgi:hypothetical protein